MKVIQSVLFVSLLCALCFGSTETYAQGENTLGKQLNFGVGASSWGIPVFVNLEIPLKTENITLHGGLSYRSKKESYNYYFYDNITWRHSITGIHFGGSYYVNDLLELPEEFDLFGGVELRYFIWKTKVIDQVNGFNESYRGSGSGGIGVGAFVGGRYHFNDKLSVYLLGNGGYVLSGARLGLTLALD